jgi:uncharacterized Zn-binding protein involved in type VI secretion
MDEQGAARALFDAHTCITPGAIVGGSTNVYVNGKKFARMADKLECCGGDIIVTGAATVRVNGLPAARTASRCLRGGIVVGGSRDVRVGGPETERVQKLDNYGAPLRLLDPYERPAPEPEILYTGGPATTPRKT